MRIARLIVDSRSSVVTVTAMAPYLIGDIASFIRELAGPSTTLPGPFDNVLGPLSRLLIFLANLAGGVVIGVATLRALGQYLVVLVRMRGDTMPDEAIRLSLGRSLSLALEFQLAADILGTALNPTLRDIATLAAIAALRTALNYFLGRELRDAQQRTGMLPNGITPAKPTIPTTPTNSPDAMRGDH